MADNTFWDKQLARALQTPNLSPAQVRELENWAHDGKVVDKGRALSVVAEMSKGAKAMEMRLKDEAKEAVLGLHGVVKEAQAHRVDSTELSAEIDKCRQVLASAKARLATLENSVQRSEEIIDDPNAYVEGLYKRYPALDKRTRLVDGVLDKR